MQLCSEFVGCLRYCALCCQLLQNSAPLNYHSKSSTQHAKVCSAFIQDTGELKGLNCSNMMNVDIFDDEQEQSTQEASESYHDSD